MSRITKAAALAATVLSALTAVSSASAANWQSNGPASFAAATPTALAAVVVRTTAPSGLGYNCNQSTLSGSVAGPTGPVSTSPWTSVLTFTPAFERCNIAGSSVAISGATGSFDATSYAGGVTSGTFRGSWNANFVGACAFTVSIVAPATSNGSTLTVSPTGQSGSVTWPGTTGCNSIFGGSGGGTASAALTGNTATTPLVFTYSGTAPVITN